MNNVKRVGWHFEWDETVSTTPLEMDYSEAFFFSAGEYETYVLYKILSEHVA